MNLNNSQWCHAVKFVSHTKVTCIFSVNAPTPTQTICWFHYFLKKTKCYVLILCSISICWAALIPLLFMKIISVQNEWYFMNTAENSQSFSQKVAKFIYLKFGHVFECYFDYNYGIILRHNGGKGVSSFQLCLSQLIDWLNWLSDQLPHWLNDYKYTHTDTHTNLHKSFVIEITLAGNVMLAIWKA